MRGDKLFWIHLKHFKNYVSYSTKFLNELLDDFDANLLNIFHSNKFPSPNVSDLDNSALCASSEFDSILILLPFFAIDCF